MFRKLYILDFLANLHINRQKPSNNENPWFMPVENVLLHEKLLIFCFYANFCNLVGRLLCKIK